MYFSNICMGNWCFYGEIKITGEGDDDFDVVRLEIVQRTNRVSVLGLVDRDIMSNLRVKLREFRRNPGRFDLRARDPYFD